MKILLINFTKMLNDRDRIWIWFQFYTFCFSYYKLSKHYFNQGEEYILQWVVMVWQNSENYNELLPYVSCGFILSYHTFLYCDYFDLDKV